MGRSKAHRFRDCLVEVLKRRYRDHWWPEKPFKGQGYRCIRINDRMDPIVAHAGDMVGLSADYLCKTIGHITMWVNPLEVTVKWGEDSDRYHVLYEYREGYPQAWRIPPIIKSDDTTTTTSFHEKFKNVWNNVVGKMWPKKVDWNGDDMDINHIDVDIFE